jgi:hypothetical protein
MAVLDNGKRLTWSDGTDDLYGRSLEDAGDSEPMTRGLVLTIGTVELLLAKRTRKV